MPFPERSSCSRLQPESGSWANSNNKEHVSSPKLLKLRSSILRDESGELASLLGKDGRMENVRARLVSLTLCNEAGTRIFDDSEIVALGAKSARALDRVFSVAQRLNGIGVDQADAAKKG